MNASTPFPYRTTVVCAFCAFHNRDCDCSEREAADTGMNPVAERLRRSRRALELIDEAGEILSRTTRIVRRLMPDRRTPHGFYDPQGFVAASNYHSDRKRLFKQVQPRIEEKVRGRALMGVEPPVVLKERGR